MSVRLICRDQEQWIGQALEGVLMQRTTFRFDVVVGDDLSSDRTLEIVKHYEERYPQLIRVLDRRGDSAYCAARARFGRLYNFYDTLRHCRGRYVALLDGDDYWSDHAKLQNQLDIIASGRWALCHHNMTVVTRNGQPSSVRFKRWNEQRAVSSLVDALQEPIAFTSSAMFRNDPSVTRRFRACALNTYSGDWCLWVLLCLQGQALFLPDVMGAYRHGVGVSSTISKLQFIEGRIRFLECLAQSSLGRQHREDVWKALARNRDLLLATN